MRAVAALALAFAGAAHAYLRHLVAAKMVLQVVIEEMWLMVVL